MTGILQSVSAIDEADCQPGVGQPRMCATLMLPAFKSDADPQPDTSSACCAAQILGGLFYKWMYLCREAQGFARVAL
jgi:hypothetical protein